MKKLLILILFVGLFSSYAKAQTFNSQGASTAPVSVTNAVKAVLLTSANRHKWCIIPETVAIRCIWSGTGAASPAPSATVGYFFPSGVERCEAPQPVGVPDYGSLHEEVDCFSTGAATNVDTVEYPN